MNPIQKQNYYKGINAIKQGAMTLVCTNGPFPKGASKEAFTAILSRFLNEIEALAKSNGLQ